MCQRKYALELILDVGLLGCKPINFSIDTHCKLSIYDGDLLEDDTGYRRHIIRLLYLIHTRPNITYPIHYLSQFLNTHWVPHMHVAIKIFKYVKMALGQVIYFWLLCISQRITHYLKI